MEAAVNNVYGCQTCARILVCSRPQHGIGAGHHAEGDVVCQMIVNVKHNLAYIRHVSYGLQLQADGLNTQSGMQYMFKADMDRACAWKCMLLYTVFCAA